MKVCDFYINGKSIAKGVKYCESFISKVLGLMFVSSPGRGAFLPGVNDIHMNFVRFNLYVIWLDKDMRVLQQTIAKPWRLYYGPSGGSNVLELPVGNRIRISKGDKLRIRIYEIKNRKS
ncbi:DUF192 domain-containing protein [Candidatus Parvarchaeota archaeon]|nr:DUF192 domain-containing protein [Candidatus Parvarchaeota archaeon]